MSERFMMPQNKQEDLIFTILCVLFIPCQCSLEKPFPDVKILGKRNYAVRVISGLVALNGSLTAAVGAFISAHTPQNCRVLLKEP